MERYLLRQCSICLDAPESDVELPCGHKFCQGCIETWFSIREQCPKKCGLPGVRLKWTGMEIIAINVAPEEGDNPFDEVHTQGDTAREGALVAYDSPSDEEGLLGQDMDEGKAVEVVQEAAELKEEEWGDQDADMEPEVDEHSAVFPEWFSALPEAQQQEVSAFIRCLSAT
jgi:hypothetical protein